MVSCVHVCVCVCVCTKKWYFVHVHAHKWYFVCVQTGDSVSVPKRAAAEQRAVPMAATLLTEVNPSHDDLRSGAFVYIHNGTH